MWGGRAVPARVFLPSPARGERWPGVAGSDEGFVGDNSAVKTGEFQRNAAKKDLGRSWRRSSDLAKARRL